MSPAERFTTLKDRLGDAFEVIEIDSSKGNAAGFGRIAHSVLSLEVREIEGWVTVQGLTDLESWLVSVTAASPAVNAWFPTSYGKPQARLTADGGSVVTRYDVSLTLVKVR